jgi:heme-degrading monooxygenase HmoA
VLVFARVSHARYPPEHREVGLQVILEELLPGLRQSRGYQGCCLLAHGKPGTGLSVVFWESEQAANGAAMNATVSAAHVKLAALGLAIDARQIYDVVICDRW